MSDPHIRKFWRPWTMEEFIEENPPWLRGRLEFQEFTVKAVAVDKVGVLISDGPKGQQWVSFVLLFENFRYLCRPDGWQVCGKLRDDDAPVG